MKIIRNSIGWEDEFGFQLAYDKEHSFMNIGRHPNQQRPVWNSETAVNSKEALQLIKKAKKGETIIWDETKANPHDAIKSYEDLF